MPNLHSVFASILLLATLPAWAGVELATGVGTLGDSLAQLAIEPSETSGQQLDPTDPTAAPPSVTGLTLTYLTASAATPPAISRLIDRPERAYQARAPPH